MIKLAPLLLAVGYAVALYLFSAWRTKRVLDQQSTPLRDPELERLTGQMAQALDLPQVPVSIFEIEPINGLAAPDGRIFLTRGFYQKYRRGEVTAEELASVIAHELGHVALGHTRRRMIDFSGQNAVFVSLVALFLRAIPVVGPLLAVWLANFITSILAARLSRRDEYEADAWASALLMKAGIGTAPQKSLFRKLDALTGSRLAGAPAWLLSHPKTAERIAAIEANEARWTSAGTE
ncbi:putative metalloprotease [Gemmobacter megaterium]|uniref:Putative metalloprotease n=1 Tax=Gemmobacter megaterium TaxID=1086013 RepID=A0A1N7KL59_9RHOB|nr:M48 family metallopeptidase [Gemmobacter megaterium]SIS62244.1 putative metalloprotease [Gemmobacter megaterium]